MGVGSVSRVTKGYAVGTGVNVLLHSARVHYLWITSEVAVVCKCHIIKISWDQAKGKVVKYVGVCAMIEGKSLLFKVLEKALR